MGQSHRAELSQLRSMMTGQGQSVDEIATAVRTRYGYSLRAAYRHTMGWTLDQAAERYNHAADDADAHLSGPRLSEWENWPQTGTRRPTAFNLLILSKIYSTHPSRLFTHEEEQRLDHRDRALLRQLHEPQSTSGHAPAEPVGAPGLPTATAHPNDDSNLPADAGLTVPWTAAGSLQALRVVTDPGPMQPLGRRQFVFLAGAAATAPAHEWLIARPVEDAAGPGRKAVSTTLVDCLDAATAHLRQLDDEGGGTSLLDVVRGHLRYVVDVIENSRYTETVGRRLYATAAELLRLAGQTCFDVSHHAQAQRYWIAALHAANAAGDRALGANILAFMSVQAVDLGNIRDSMMLAQTARAGYPGNSPKVAAFLDMQDAHAHALDGATTGCRRALDAAFDRLNDAPPPSGEPDWSYWIDEAQAHAYAGSCYLRLKDWPRARGHLREALRLQETSFPRDAALRRIRLATTYLQDPTDLDQAIALGTQATDALSGTINSKRCVKHLAPLVKGLAPFRQRPAVREFTDRATALLTVAK